MNRWYGAGMMMMVAVVGLGAVVACSSPDQPTAAADRPEAQAVAMEQDLAAVPSPSLVGTVTETMDSGGYTYVLVDTGADPVWAATPQFEVAVGDEVEVHEAMPMADYHSNTLDRTFAMVYFSPSITSVGAGPATAATGHPGGPIPSPEAPVDLEGIDKAQGGYTVGELFAERENLAGNEVAVRGRVVKFLSGIMGKNWIHLRDGSGAPGADDLTVTTDQQVEVGDTVVVRGVAAVDKDFGYGYRYGLIVEDATLAVE